IVITRRAAMAVKAPTSSAISVAPISTRAAKPNPTTARTPNTAHCRRWLSRASATLLVVSRLLRLGHAEVEQSGLAAEQAGGGDYAFPNPLWGSVVCVHEGSLPPSLCPCQRTSSAGGSGERGRPRPSRASPTR